MKRLSQCTLLRCMICFLYISCMKFELYSILRISRFAIELKWSCFIVIADWFLSNYRKISQSCEFESLGSLGIKGFSWDVESTHKNDSFPGHWLKLQGAQSGSLGSGLAEWAEHKNSSIIDSSHLSIADELSNSCIHTVRLLKTHREWLGSLWRLLVIETYLSDQLDTGLSLS